MPKLSAKNAATTTQSMAVSVIERRSPLAAKEASRARGNARNVRTILGALALVLAISSPASAAALPAAGTPEPALLPRPSSVQLVPNCVGPRAADVARALDGRKNGLRDEGEREILRDRWTPLGIRPASGPATVHLSLGLFRGMRAPDFYRLHVDAQGIEIDSNGGAGEFYAVVTLAQLARRVQGVWRLPCE